MEKSLLLLTSAKTDLTLALVRFQNQAVLSKEPLTVAIDCVVRDLAKALPLLAQSPNEKAAGRLLQWLVKEKTQLVLAALTELLQSQSSENANWHKVSFMVLRFLTRHVDKIRLQFVQQVTPQVSKLVLCSNDNGYGRMPNRLQLLARDFVYFSICKQFRQAAAQSESSHEKSYADRTLYENRKELALVLDAESFWTRSFSPCLFIALQDLLQNVQFASASQEQDEIDFWCDRLNSEFSSCLELLAKRTCDSVLLQKDLDTLSNSNLDVITARMSLRNCCLLVGRNDIKTSPLPYDMQSLLVQGATRALKQSKLSKSAQKMAACLLQSCLAHSTQRLENSWLSLLPLLDEKDGISIGAIEIIADFIYQDPSAGLQELQSRLSDPNSKAKRENAVAVLNRIVELRELSHEVPASKGCSKVDEHLAALLISRLGDENLDIQLQASRVFSVMPPSSILPQLCALFNDQTNERTNAIAAECFIRTMSMNRNLKAAVEELLWRIPPRAQEVAFALTERWVCRIDPPDVFHSVLDTIIDACVELSSSSPQVIGFARRLGPIISSNPGTSLSIWVNSLMVVIKKQALETDVLKKLTPFLLIRILPQIHMETDASLLIEVLCNTILNETEHAEIKRTAVESLARVRPSVTACQFFLGLVTTRGFQAKLELVRAGMFGLCNVIINNLAWNEPYHELYSFATIADSLFQQVADLVGREDDQTQLVLAASADLLALQLIYERLSIWEETSSSIKPQEVTTSDTVQPDVQRSDTLRALIASLFGTSPSESQEALSCQALCLCSRCFLAEGKVDSLASSAMRSLLTEERLRRAGIGFARESISICLARISENQQQLPSEQQMFTVFSCLFLASTALKQQAELQPLGAEPNPHHEFNILELGELLNISLELLRSRNTPHTSIAVKVLGVLLTLPEELLASLPAGSLGRVHSILQSTANLDESEESRRLATQVLNLSFQ